MEIIVLDTDFVIEFLNNNEAVIKYLSELHNFFAITVITKAEIIQGSKNKQHQNKLIKLIDNFKVIDINTDISKHFTYLFAKYYLSHNCAIPDTLNASVVLAKDLYLLTFNQKDYKYIQGVKLMAHGLKLNPKSF